MQMETESTPRSLQESFFSPQNRDTLFGVLDRQFKKKFNKSIKQDAEGSIQDLIRTIMYVWNEFIQSGNTNIHPQQGMSLLNKQVIRLIYPRLIEKFVKPLNENATIANAVLDKVKQQERFRNPEQQYQHNQGNAMMPPTRNLGEQQLPKKMIQMPEYDPHTFHPNIRPPTPKFEQDKNTTTNVNEAHSNLIVERELFNKKQVTACKLFR